MSGCLGETTRLRIKKYESYFIDSEPRGLTSEQTPLNQLAIKFGGDFRKHSVKHLPQMVISFSFYNFS